MPPKAKAAAKAPPATSYQARAVVQRPSDTAIPAFVPSSMVPVSRVPEVGPIFSEEVVHLTDFLPAEVFVDSACQTLRLWPESTRWRRLGLEDSSDVYPPPIAAPAAAPKAAAKAKAGPPGKTPAVAETSVAERLAEFQKQKPMWTSRKFVPDGKQPAFVQWFYSALAAIELHAVFLEMPLHSLVYPQNSDKFPLFNPRGKYVVRLCVRGRWTAVTVDDFVPEILHPEFSHSDLWPAILAKALLKAYAPSSESEISSSWMMHIPLIASLTGWTRQDASLGEADFVKFPIATISLATELAPVAVAAVEAVVENSESEISDSEEEAEKRPVVLSPRISGHSLIFSLVQIDEDLAQVRGLLDARLQPEGGEKTRDESTDIHGTSDAHKAETLGDFRSALIQQSADAEGSFWLSEISDLTVRMWRPATTPEETHVVDAAEFPIYVQLQSEVIGNFFPVSTEDRKYVRFEKLAAFGEKNLHPVFEPSREIGRVPEILQPGVYRVSKISDHPGLLRLAGAVKTVKDERALAEISGFPNCTVVTVQSEISAAQAGYAVVMKKSFFAERNSFRLFGALNGLEAHLKISMYKFISDFQTETVFSYLPLSLAAEFPSVQDASLVLVVHGDLPVLTNKFPITLHFVGLQETREKFPVQWTPGLSFFADQSISDSRHFRVFRERLTVASDAASASVRISVPGNFQVQLFEQKSPTENLADACDPTQYKRLRTLHANLVSLVSKAGTDKIFLPHLPLRTGVVYVLETTCESVGNFPWRAEIFGAAVELGSDRMQPDIEKLLVATWQNGNAPQFPGGISELWKRYYAQKETENAPKITAIRAKKPSGKNKDAELAAQDKEVASLTFKAPVKEPGNFSLVDFPNPTVRAFAAELLGAPWTGSLEPTPVTGKPGNTEIESLSFPVKVFERVEKPEEASLRAELHALGKRRSEIVEIFRVKCLAQGPGNLDGFTVEEAQKLLEEGRTLEVERIDKLDWSSLVRRRVSLVLKIEDLTTAAAVAPIDEISDEELKTLHMRLAEISDLAESLKEKNVPIGEEMQNKLNALVSLINK